MAKIHGLALLTTLVVFYLLHNAEGTEESKQLSPQSKETNTVNFVRLLIMRLIYGIASVLGLEENLQDVFGGIFVPPGVDDDDDDYLGGDLIPDGFF